jgi:hypothetical protein
MLSEDIKIKTNKNKRQCRTNFSRFLQISKHNLLNYDSAFVTKGLVLARQVLYHFSHLPALSILDDAFFNPRYSSL